MTTRSTASLLAYYHPRYWPTWLGIAALSLLAWSPWTLRRLVGKTTGLMLYHIARDRAYITRVNIQLCFPELIAKQQDNLVRASFISNGLGLIETATGWFRSRHYFSNKVKFINLELLQAARSKGRGVLLIGAHYSTLDLGTNLLSTHCPFAVTYRPHGNPLFDAFIMRGRLNNCSHVFDRQDIRGAFRHLKKGEVLWYAPDQDYGLKHAVMAPFFGQPAATITATSRFASINQSSTLVVRQHRLNEQEQYEIEFIPVPDTFPSGDDARDAALINRMLESAIRQHPDQYLWMHKRFKSHSDPDRVSPYIDIKTGFRKVPAERFALFISNATPLPAASDGYPRYLFPDGTVLLLFPGLASRLWRKGHRVWRADRISKALRSAGIDCIAIERIFQLPKERQTGVSFQAPVGTPWSEYDSLPAEAWARLGAYLARLHDKGFMLEQCRPDQLFLSEHGLQLANPQELSQRPMSLGSADRADQLATVLSTLTARHDDARHLYQSYCQASEMRTVDHLDTVMKKHLADDPNSSR